MDGRTYGELVDQETGVIARAVFDSPQVYEVEQRKVFARSWLFVAHASQLRRAGDFVVSRMGEDSVIVSRQSDGGIAVLLNVCRHKGMRVCRADEGSATRFTCAYHGWSYNGAGALVDVPHEADGYRGRLDKARWSLLRVPRVESFLGLVFACWDLDAPSLADWLGPAVDLVRGAFDRSAAGTEVLGGVQKWRLRGNWKLAAEQFTGDNYHAETTHSSAFTAQIAARAFDEEVFQRLADVGREGSGMVNVGFPHGHGATVITGGEEAFRAFHTAALPPELHSTVDPARAHERLGELAFGPGTMVNLVCPNLAWLGNQRTLRVFHPHGPDAMEIWSWVYVDADWPEETKQAYRRHSTRSFSTTGIFEVDDSENWAEINAVGAGHVTARVPLNYQMGLGRDTGGVNSAYSDTSALNFHRRWVELMDGPDPRLPDLSPAPLLPEPEDG
ncbi:aromatic ring-hydroxylating dioxygenase subunit alpha [Allokutzneria sp. A3M-2-11 16]|uniref:aromatic ring-hydroxylating oxygenase subunit alpha n=1 Tax=Allokutzneria sp. A3M-2-11 16 TaxID=2962043 RepID=UPI0020B6DFFC|nr:aromatic ring-hydroxylating dioxygenase subunit alpha [Allokutzneria sp. A3M-2-11 16]MCP3805017.1 aromatic ring-hydroxylating dioxygenase subunit alpha [Allokutzneria sp. A3M-2-11 16]